MVSIKTALLNAYVTTACRDARSTRLSDRAGAARAVSGDDAVHLRAALDWLCRAQDAGNDNGVAAMYSLVRGWMASYPETTGYIIPTFFDMAALITDAEVRRRAVAMTRWLRSCQREDGAFCGLFVDRPAPPRVFNTGQAVFGLLRTAHETADESFLRSARRAAEWLLAAQDGDGAWRRHTLNGIPHAYNARTAWALAQLAQTVDDARLLDSAIRAADWTVSRQRATGWFSDNTFHHNEQRATLHTIAYVMQGLLEIGVAARRSEYIAAARAPAEQLWGIWKRDRFLAGAYDRNWRRDVSWRCLPGECQLALVWLRLDQLSGHPTFSGAAVELLEQVKTMQFMDPNHPDLHGGLTGCWPVDASYERYCLVNWGPKFLIDALLLKGRTDGKHPTG